MATQLEIKIRANPRDALTRAGGPECCLAATKVYTFIRCIHRAVREIRLRKQKRRDSLENRRSYFPKSLTRYEATTSRHLEKTIRHLEKSTRHLNNPRCASRRNEMCIPGKEKGREDSESLIFLLQKKPSKGLLRQHRGLFSTHRADKKPQAIPGVKKARCNFA